MLRSHPHHLREVYLLVLPEENCINRQNHQHERYYHDDEQNHEGFCVKDDLGDNVKLHKSRLKLCQRDLQV